MAGKKGLKKRVSQVRQNIWDLAWAGVAWPCNFNGLGFARGWVSSSLVVARR